MLFSSPVLFELPVLPRVQKYVRHKLTDASGQAHPLLAIPEASGPGQVIWWMAQSPKQHLFTNYNARPSSTRSGGGAAQPVSMYSQQPGKSPAQKPGSRVYFDQKLTATLGVGISEFHHSRHQYLLNFVELEVFSNLIDYLIHDEVVRFCQASPGSSPMVRIKAFCDRYDFAPDELAESALKQMYLRYRKGRAGATYGSALATQVQFVPHIIAAA